MKQNINLITIGYAKRAFESGSREQERMKEYATRLQSLHMIVFTRKSDGYASSVIIGNLTLHPTNSSTKIGMLVDAIRIGRQILKAHCDEPSAWVVSSQDPFETSLVGRLIVHGTQISHHVQVHGDVLNLNFASGLFAYIRNRYARYVLKRTSCIRVVSERIKHSVTTLGVGTSRITVVPIQASLSNFLKVGTNRTYEAREPIRFVFIGRFASEKNVLLIIRSIAEARKEGIECTLACVGDGPEKETVQQVIDELGLTSIVQFLPWTQDIVSVLKDADVLLLSSNHEGWAMVLVEAMAAGLPVITTDVGCAGELVQNGEHGYVVPVGDVAAYTKAIVEISRDAEHRAAFGRAAHKTIKQWMLTDEEYLERWVSALQCDHIQ